MKSVKISPIFLIACLISYIFGFFSNYITMFLIIFFHELAHLIAICIKNIEISFIRIEAFGVNIKLKTNVIREPENEIVMCLAGPLCNFLLSAISFYFLNYKINDTILFFATANLIMGIYNLLPVLPLDGGRILKAMLTRKMGYLKSYHLMAKITKLFSVILIIVGIYVLIKTKFNFTLAIIGAFIYFNLLTEKSQTHLYIMEEIANYKRKNINFEQIPINYLAVNKNLSALKITKQLTYNRYYILNVLDGINIIGTITEGQLIEGMIRYGSTVTIEKLLNFKKDSIL